MNQSDLAAVIGVSLRTIQLYEKKDANIPIKNLGKIADFFEISIGELYLHEVNETDGQYSKKRTFLSHGNIGYRLDKGKVVLKVPLVTATSHNALVDNFQDESFIKGLFRIDFLVQVVEEAFYMAFEVLGDAMNDGTSHAIPSGALVLGKKTAKNTFLSNTEYINRSFVLVCTDRIICKSITGISVDKKALVCHNLNPSPEFTDFEVPIDKVLGLYEVVKKQV